MILFYMNGCRMPSLVKNNFKVTVICNYVKFRLTLYE